MSNTLVGAAASASIRYLISPYFVSGRESALFNTLDFAISSIASNLLGANRNFSQFLVGRALGFLAATVATTAILGRQNLAGLIFISVAAQAAGFCANAACSKDSDLFVM